MSSVIKFEEVERKIVEIRGLKVILDSDVAVLYGVVTRDINKAVKNNPDKFPEGYVFELKNHEKHELVENFHRFNSMKHSSVTPKVFTESELYMLATILKGSKATATTLSVIETFARFKHLSKTIKELSVAQDAKQKQGLMHKSGEIIAEILDNDLTLNESESTIELNFAFLKVKHTIKKKKK